jgi:hypothetical protein
MAQVVTVFEARVAPERVADLQGAGKPRGLQIFEAACANPSVAIYDTIACLEPPTRAP